MWGIVSGTEEAPASDGNPKELKRYIGSRDSVGHCCPFS